MSSKYAKKNSSKLGKGYLLMSGKESKAFNAKSLGRKDSKGKTKSKTRIFFWFKP
jgi:hypothetical protein